MINITSSNERILIISERNKKVEIFKSFKQHRFFIQCLSILVSALILISAFPINLMNVKAESTQVWDGTAAADFAGGNGTESTPFLIENANQLYKMLVEYHTYAASNGKYFKITKDIYLNDVVDGTSVKALTNKKNWLADYGNKIATASKSNSFNGNLDGGNNTIYGLYVDGIKSAGLFPAISSYAVIENLSFENLYITGGNGFGGAIAGQAIYYHWNSAAKITNCSVVDATIGESNNIEFVGGFIGDIKECSVHFTNCYTYDISLSDKATPGGMVGYAYSGGTLKMTNCYSIGHFPTRSNNSKAVCANVYTDTAAPTGNTTANVMVLTSEQMKGENAKQNMSGFDFEFIWQIAEDNYPVLNKDVWDGTKAEEFAGGSGTENDPYLIEDGAQLYKMVADYSNTTTSEKPESHTYFKITKDINLGKKQWYTINVKNWLDNAAYSTIGFSGIIYGEGHTIKGLYNNKAAGAVGLIPVATQGAEIHDLHLDTGTLPRVNYQTYAVGAFVGLAKGAGNSKPIVIRGCSVKNFTIASCNGSGGFVGYLYSQSVGIYNSYCVNTTISHTAASSANSAGFIGYTGGNEWLNNIIVANSYCVDVSPLPYLNDNFQKITTFEDVYTTNEEYDNSVAGVTKLTSEQMTGANAEQNMTGFDFERTWKSVEGDYPINFIYVKPDYIWNGDTAKEFAGGKGTSDNPYLISDGAQLYKMVKEYTNAPTSKGSENTITYFKLTNDIYLNDVKERDMIAPSEASWGALFNPWYSISSKNVGFCGDLDGSGYTVYGLYCANPRFSGLIPMLTDGGSIHNLSLKNSYIKGYESAGGIVGYVYGDYRLSPSKVSYCTVDKTVIEGSGKQIGGIVGGCNDLGLTVSDCSVVRTKVTSSNAENPNLASGIIGYGWGGTKKAVNCFTDSLTHPITATTDKTSFDTIDNFVSHTNVYTSATKNFDAEGIIYLTDEQMKGENAKQYMTGLDFDRVWKTVEGDYPVHIIYERPSHVWDGTKAEEFAGGSGTAYDPYLIANGAQLYKMVVDYSNAVTAKDSDNKTTYFKLTKDIHLNDINVNDLTNPSAEAFSTKFNSWYSLSGTGKGFCGELDGDGHTVYGLFATGGFAGLIPLLTDGGCIRNLNLENSFVNGSSTGGSSGGLVGYVGGHYTLAPVSVTYCTVDNTVVKGASSRVAGIIGGFEQIKITLSDCSVTRVKLTSTDKEKSDLVSAFIGNGWGISGHKINNCFTDSSAHPVAVTTDNTVFNTMAEARIYTNVYTSATKKFDVDGITYLDDDGKLKGLSVNKILKGFDFTNDWCAVSNDYPVIKKGAGNWLYDKTIPGEVWSGKLARVYASGEGTKENPYIIKTGGHLALLANDALNGKTTNKYYKITEDIILNDTSSENWKENANEWFTGKWAQAFRGHLDGGYHIVSGLYLNKTKDNYTGTDYYGGLFACIGKNAVIEKLGIVNSSLTFTDAVSQRYVGAFAGFVDQYDSSANKASHNEYPIIRECFADTTVFLDANSCGGFIGCATRPIRVEDSFFTGKVNSTARGLFGYSKMGYEVEETLVKNFYTADSKYAVLSNASYDNIKCENCYSSSAQDKVGLTRLFIDRMVGTAAKEYMTGFDFDKIWTVRADNETPGLKGFNSKAYSNIMSPEDIVISFETNCDLQVESITGKAYSKLTLPELSREGYIFEGWYSFPELDVPFNYDYFPTFNTILYAKWTLSGFIQDFELYEDSVYDYHEGYEYYRPTTPNYSADYVHGGGKSMHRVGGSDEALDFLLFYAEELEVGKTYKMSYYVTTDQEKASVDMSLVHLDWPDVYCDSKGVDTLSKLDNLKDGEWQECTYTFVAKSKWIAVRTSGKDSVYFDDFILYTTDDSANVGADLSGGFNSLWIIIAVSAAVVVILGAGVTVFIIKKRAKQK